MKSGYIGEKSPETQALRKKIAAGCEQLIWDFFEGGGQVVIYDANNGTRAGRQALAEKFDKAGIHVVMLGTPLTDIFCILYLKRSFAETLCDNKEIIETNIRSVKISSPDVCTDTPCSRNLLRNPDLGQYRGWDPDKAVQDYYLRIRDHEKYYETVDETTWPFIRIINVSIHALQLYYITYIFPR